MAQSFDREAFLEAARAAAQPKLVGVTLAGVGECWVRPLTAGDWMNAQAAEAKLKAEGVEITPAVRMAIGLAHNLCGPAGEALFDGSNRADIETLAGLPMDSVTGALVKAGHASEGAGDPKA